MGDESVEVEFIRGGGGVEFVSEGIGGDTEVQRSISQTEFLDRVSACTLPFRDSEESLTGTLPVTRCNPSLPFDAARRSLSML